MFRLRAQKCKEWLRSPSARRMGILAVALLAVFAVPNLAHAFDPIGIFLGLLARFFEMITRLIGLILFLEVKALIDVVQYSNFVAPGPTAVQVGWVVARDLANMFFILILLVIAFATIVGYEEYNLRKLLPRLLIMAVVINFSKTITGIFIDLGQVIMLTFVNGFKDAAGGNFVNAFQVEKLLRLSKSGDMSQGGLVLAMMLAAVMVGIAAMVVLVMLVTLAFRIVMLWILIILAPIAFLASTIPPGQKYYSMWWDELKRYIIYGPVVAFFLWLALLTAQKSNGNIAAGEKIALDSGGATELEVQNARGSTDSGKIPSAAAESDVIISMIIFTSLLFGGLKVATQVGGVAGGALSTIKRTGRRAVKSAAKFGGRIGKWAGKKTVGYGLRGGGAVLRGTASAPGGLARVVAGTKWGKATKRKLSESERLGKLAQNKFAHGAGLVARGVGKATAGVIGGAGVAASVQGRRVTGTGGFKKAKEAVFGSKEEREAAGAGTVSEAAGKSKATGRKQKRVVPIAQVGAEGTEKRKAFMSGAKILTENDAANKAFLDSLFEGGAKRNVAMKRKELQKVIDEGGEDAPEARRVLKAFEEKNVEHLSAKAPVDKDGHPKIDENTGQPMLSDQERVIRGMKMKDIPFGLDKNEAVADHMADLISHNPRAIEDVKGGPDGAAMRNIRESFKRKTDEAMESGDTSKAASLAVDSLLVGALTAEEYRGNEGLRGAVGKGLNPQFMLKNMNPKDENQLNLAKAMMSDFQSQNPERAKKLNATGQFDHLLPEGGATSPAAAEPAAETVKPAAEPATEAAPAPGAEPAAETVKPAAEPATEAAPAPGAEPAAETAGAEEPSADESGTEGKKSEEVRVDTDEINKKLEAIKQALKGASQGGSDSSELKSMMSALQSQMAIRKGIEKKLAKSSPGSAGNDKLANELRKVNRKLVKIISNKK